jgi:hypothetical protein
VSFFMRSFFNTSAKNFNTSAINVQRRVTEEIRNITIPEPRGNTSDSFELISPKRVPVTSRADLKDNALDRFKGFLERHKGDSVPIDINNIPNLYSDSRNPSQESLLLPPIARRSSYSDLRTLGAKKRRPSLASSKEVSRRRSISNIVKVRQVTPEPSPNASSESLSSSKVRPSSRAGSLTSNSDAWLSSEDLQTSPAASDVDLCSSNSSSFSLISAADARRKTKGDDFYRVHTDHHKYSLVSKPQIPKESQILKDNVKEYLEYLLQQLDYRKNGPVFSPSEAPLAFLQEQVSSNLPNNPHLLAYRAVTATKPLRPRAIVERLDWTNTITRLYDTLLQPFHTISRGNDKDKLVAIHKIIERICRSDVKKMSETQQHKIKSLDNWVNAELKNDQPNLQNVELALFDRLEMSSALQVTSLNPDRMRLLKKWYPRFPERKNLRFFQELVAATEVQAKHGYPFKKRAQYLIYGASQVGKTHSIQDLVDAMGVVCKPLYSPPSGFSGPYAPNNTPQQMSFQEKLAKTAESLPKNGWILIDEAAAILNKEDADFIEQLKLDIHPDNININGVPVTQSLIFLMNPALKNEALANRLQITKIEKASSYSCHQLMDEMLSRNLEIDLNPTEKYFLKDSILKGLSSKINLDPNLAQVAQATQALTNQLNIAFEPTNRLKDKPLPVGGERLAKIKRILFKYFDPGVLGAVEESAGRPARS